MHIDTRIGTKNSVDFSHGNTLPLTGMPFAMNYLSVQTTTADTAWWFDPDSPIFAGLRLTHQPSPWIGDFQHVTIRPFTDEFSDLDTGVYRPSDAIFSPQLLQLVDTSQQIEIQATHQVYGGAIKLRSLTDSPLSLQLKAPQLSFVTAEADALHFTTQNFSASEDPNFTMYLTLQAKARVEVIASDEILIHFDRSSVELPFATSFISADQADFNLDSRAFTDQLRLTTRSWQQVFDLVEIQDSHVENISTFYHNLYRSFLFPMQFYETNAQGQAIHYSTHLHQVMPGKLYTNNGFWDTYKTVFPLFSLLIPDQYGQFLEGFLNSYRETGFLPRWLSPDERGMMPGTMIDAIIADAAVKNIAPHLLPELFQAMVHGATTISDDPRYGREGLAEYLQLGYVPADIPESVNKTLDYAYSDWLISVVAQKLGHTDQAEHFARRSQNYHHLFDQNVGLMHPKDRAGHFTADFDALRWGDGFTEGSAWQNSFAVYQDFPGLIADFGGSDQFLKQLHHLVNQPAQFHVGSYHTTIHEMREMAAQNFGQLAISNQPSFHLPYLFAVAGEPHSTEILIKQLLHVFNAGPNGYPGDEDNGSMSSWYLWSSLGLYPLTPGSGDYVFGSPLFDHVTLHLPEGPLTMSANQAATHSVVAERRFNGEQLQNQVSHQHLAHGGALTVRMETI